MASPSRYRQRKDANQGEIVAALEAIGCDVIVMHSPTDLLVGYRGRNWLLEVKNPDKPPSGRKLTPAQVKFHGNWRGQKATVLSADEAIAAVTVPMSGVIGFSIGDPRKFGFQI